LGYLTVTHNLTRGNALLMGRDEVHGDEPLLQRQFGVLEYSAGSTREIVLAVIAAKASVLASCTMVLSAMWADHIVTPTYLFKGLLANLLVTEVS
jgi:hypothetical protein